MQTGKYEKAYRGAGLHLLGKIQLKSKNPKDEKSTCLN